MQLELRIVHRDGKEVLQTRTVYLEVTMPPFFSFRDPEIEVVRSEWKDVPHERE